MCLTPVILLTDRAGAYGSFPLTPAVYYPRLCRTYHLGDILHRGLLDPLDRFEGSQQVVDGLRSNALDISEFAM